MAMSSTSEFDTAVLGEINQRTLVGGALIDTAPIAAQVGISRGQLSDSLERLRAKSYVVLGAGETASITPMGHASLT